MTSSIEYLQNLIEKLGDDWKKELDNYIKDDSSENFDDKDIETCFQNFITAWKEEIIDNKSSNAKHIEKLIDNDLLYNSLKAYINDSLALYYAAEPLRVLELKDSDKVLKLVDLVFEQGMLRFNPAISDNYQEFLFESKETFISILNVFDSLCTFALTHNLYHAAIAEAVYINLRLSKKLCKYIAEKIDKNFDQLRLKMIMEKLYSEN